MLTHSAFLPVTGLLLMNKEIGQSTLRTYGLLLHMLNLHIVVWFFFAILCESSKRLSILREICMRLNSYFTSSATAPAAVVVCHVRVLYPEG